MIWKIKVWVLRLWEYIRLWPFRLWSLAKWLCWIEHPSGSMVFVRWWACLFMKIVDLTPIPYIVEMILDIVKWNTRSLNEDEKVVIKSVFGAKVNTNLVGVDDQSWFAKRNVTRAYVGLHTINYYKLIPDSILVHECVHIRQFHVHGSMYILEAFYAQYWGGGYNYGGEAGLLAKKEEGLMAFNFEQQAEMVEDYYRKGALAPEIYRRYVEEV